MGSWPWIILGGAFGGAVVVVIHEAWKAFRDLTRHPD